MDLVNDIERDAGAASDDLEAALAEIVGADALTVASDRRTFFSTDISGPGWTARAVVTVGDPATLSRVVRACTGRGAGVVPRGGGFSYTGGYTPSAPGAVIVDMRGMNRVVEINAEDMYVVVETGCTWANLYDALKPLGLRTPYFGPISGFHATVGGALSQGSFFLGSTQYGAVADSVLGLEIVLGDGTILTTGSGGSSEDASPFFRQYGPDATGLFLSDSGALGLKTKAVLRLIPFPPHQAYATFAFDSHAPAVAACSAIGRSALAAECYCWDPHFVRLMTASSGGLRQQLGFLLNVAKAGSSWIDGAFAALRIALAGKRALRGDTWLVHVTIDDFSAAGASAKLRQVRTLARAQGGAELVPTAPRTLRGTPFTDFNTHERRTLRRNLPVHGIAPHSRAQAVAADVVRCLAEHAEPMRRLGVTCGMILLPVGAQALCVEPLLSWDDPEQAMHNRVDETSDLAGLAGFSERPEATRLAMELKAAFIAIFRGHGCVHVQVGRSYPWAETRQPALLALIAAVQDLFDPARLVNRGALGLGGPAG